MKIATLNINSVNARLGNLCNWLQNNQPDVMMLQEIKCEFNNFPFFDIQILGYDVKILGQKSYNGVAVLSRHKLNVCAENLPNFPDENARYLECDVNINSRTYTVASLYLPNGNPPYNNPADTSRLAYKLDWMEAFLRHVEELRLANKNIILAGDYNVILSDKDVYNPELFRDNALFLPQVRNKLNLLLRSGYADCFRQLHPAENGYTFWDYTGNAWQNDLGMRIDYILASPYLSDCLLTCKVDKSFRALEKTSDHTILTAEFKD